MKKQSRMQKKNIQKGYEMLANAIIVQAAQDFRAAYKRLKWKPDDPVAKHNIQEITQFFHSDYFCMLSDLDGPSLLRRIIREMEKK